MCSLDPLEPPINPFCEGWKTGLILFSESMKLASVAENILYIVLVNPIGLQFSGLEGSPFLYSIIVFVLFRKRFDLFRVHVYPSFFLFIIRHIALFVNLFSSAVRFLRNGRRPLPCTGRKKILLTNY